MCTGTSSRRGFLFKLGLGLNALAAALVGVPVIGYILGPAHLFQPDVPPENILAVYDSAV